MKQQAMQRRKQPTATRRTPAREAPWARFVLSGMAALYFAGVWLDGIGSVVPYHLVPQPALHFLQVAGLFTGSATFSVDYRAEAWLCDERRWVELDTRPYFEIDAAHKENRFHRALHFFRRNRRVLQELERYLIEKHELTIATEGAVPAVRVGGMRFLSVRRPVPAPGETISRWHRVPLLELSKEQQRRWYWTPASRRAKRCGGRVPTAGEDE